MMYQTECMKTDETICEISRCFMWNALNQKTMYLKVIMLKSRFKARNHKMVKEINQRYKRGSNCVFEPLLSKGIVNR